MNVATAPSGIDPRTLKTQADASDPANSAWVSANAGSGKTFVLARRVIRLLLSGCDPARILCLTFTRAAAAEMANRVFAELRRWTTLAGPDLAAEIAEIEGSAPDAMRLARARRLFAQALDTPGGLKIQTIHAFCERLLHQFPFEANVAGHFEVLDERDEKALTAEVQRRVLAEAAADPEGVLGQALRTVLELASDATHEDSIRQYIDRRDEIRAWIVAAGSLDVAISGLRRTLWLASGDNAADLKRRIVDEAPLDAAGAARLVEHLRSGSSSDVTAAERLAPFAASTDADVRFDAWIAFMMKSTGERRSRHVTTATAAGWPRLEEMLEAECDRLEAVLDRWRTAQLFESSVAMLRLAEAAIAAYEKLKQQRGVLDFNDLVVRTVTLLSRTDASAWVHYKLDRGIDHILVDEAQDTNPRQWQVIQALAEEFFTGEGASDAVRTLFAVGDEKQSIYSFQGAVPDWFTRVQRALRARAEAAGLEWRDRELHLSFRSVSVILDAVDAVFRPEAVHRGLTAELKPTVHEARRRNEPGRVVIWPAIVKPKQEEAKDWATPLDHLGADSPEVKLAKRIAGTISGWLMRGERLDGGEPIRAGGILVLVRTRGALTDAVNRALKTADVPIAGTDRMTLTEHIAVMDLMALGRVALLPEDDLSLAALLKSPLIGLDEDAVFDLAHGRGWRSLWRALTEKSAERPAFADAKALVEGWRAEADLRDPHAFYARILGASGGRKAFLRRLGPEAEDVLDEFLAQALAYEQTNIPSLEGFLAWMVAGETEIKRDTDAGRDEVRVMTVHGAKGLEADIVFLVDNGTRPTNAVHDPRLLSLADEYDPRDPGPFVWMRSIRHMPAAVKERVGAVRKKSAEEYRRLLYVGMTRPRDRLYVAGIANQNTDKVNGWHALVRSALDPECTETVSGDGELEALEWRAEERTVRTGAPAEKRDEALALPQWATQDATPPPPALTRLVPSAIDGGGPQVWSPVTGASPDAAAMMVRGRLVHRLLQSLPDLAPADRLAAGTRYLEAVAGNLPEADRAGLLGQVMAVMDHPGFAAVFATGSRAEIDIAGRIERGSGTAVVSGRVDRLVVTPERVLVVDYKTNRLAPETLDAVPPAYVSQLAVYRSVLRHLYPDREVSAALLWTEAPRLMEIPTEALDKVEAALRAAA